VSKGGPEFKFQYHKIIITAHAQWLMPCNLSYSGGRDQEDQSSKPILGKNLARPPSQPTNLMWWCTPMIPAMNKRLQVQGWWYKDSQPWIKVQYPI
jgi:hypothetical protein